MPPITFLKAFARSDIVLYLRRKVIRVAIEKISSQLRLMSSRTYPERGVDRRRNFVDACRREILIWPNRKIMRILPTCPLRNLKKETSLVLMIQNLRNS